MNTNKKHCWTDEERKFISRCYIEEYVLKQCGIKKDYFVARMCHFLPKIKESSILMFVENTKQLTREFGVRDCSGFSSLSNYSLAHKNVMTNLLKEYKLI